MTQKDHILVFCALQTTISLPRVRRRDAVLHYGISYQTIAHQDHHFVAYSDVMLLAF
jgi:hypothetical protein